MSATRPRGVNATVEYTLMAGTRQTIGGVATLVEHGQIEPVVDLVVSFADFVEAQRHLDRGGLVGKSSSKLPTEGAVHAVHSWVSTTFP